MAENNLIDENIINYEVSPTNMKDEKSRKIALRELRILQEQSISDYKTWAKETVKYQDFGKGKNKDVQLKQCNDAYTMNMLMTSFSAFRQGVDFGSLLSFYLSYQGMKYANPDMDQDMSRFLLNFRDTMAAQREQSTGFWKAALNATISAVDRYVEPVSTTMMNNNIARNLKQHNLDDLMMSPRQLAALKLNFMEQYYVDTRSIADPMSEAGMKQFNEYKEQYDTAIRHIEAIANNSGYGMDTIAAEERYFVGLKMNENPKYRNAFANTGAAFGVIPVEDEKGLWAGGFMTIDDHNFTGAGSRTGAFSPRSPIVFNLPSYAKSLDRDAQAFSAAYLYLGSKQCTLSKAEKELLAKGLDQKMADYREYHLSIMKDDNYANGNESACEELFDRMFVDKVREYFEDDSEGKSETIMDKNRSELFENFDGNLHYIIEKECYNNVRRKMFMNLSDDDEYYDRVFNINATERDIKDKTLDKSSYEAELVEQFREKAKDVLAKYEKKSFGEFDGVRIPDDVVDLVVEYEARRRYYNTHFNKKTGVHERDTRSIDEIKEDFVQNYMRDMTSEERENLMLHTCTNMIQTFGSRGTMTAPAHTLSMNAEESAERRLSRSELQELKDKENSDEGKLRKLVTEYDKLSDEEKACVSEDYRAKVEASRNYLAGIDKAAEDEKIAEDNKKIQRNRAAKAKAVEDKYGAELDTLLDSIGIDASASKDAPTKSSDEADGPDTPGT